LPSAVDAASEANGIGLRCCKGQREATGSEARLEDDDGSEEEILWEGAEVSAGGK
jgi:hypothetical protein